MPRCQVVPQPEHQVQFLLEGREKLRWHFGPQYPRPFFYPVVGPSGQVLTRMGHPGAPSEDHHRSLWFAHFKVAGQNFWNDRTRCRIVQRQWLVYSDGHTWGGMAVALDWLDEAASPLMHQQVVAVLHPHWSHKELLHEGEWLLELQNTFRPGNSQKELVLEKTNFGPLGLRVAKSLSEHFGSGKLTSSEGRVGERAIFGRRASWVDYSGPGDAGAVEGITCFDHPANPGHPCGWHVRSNGWLGPSLCMFGPVHIAAKEPLVVRYLLHVHREAVDPKRAAAVAAWFAHRPAWQVVPARQPHEQYRLQSG